MATPTYDLISSTTLSTTATSITLDVSSITYRDIIILASVKKISGLAGWDISFNGSGTGYRQVVLEGSTSATPTAVYTSSSGNISTSWNATVMSSDAWSSLDFQIFDITSTSKTKSWLAKSGFPQLAGYAATSFASGNWSSTAAITSVRLAPWDGSSFAAGSSFYVYGVAA